MRYLLGLIENVASEADSLRLSVILERDDDRIYEKKRAQEDMISI
jgi:hypothetical protein